MKTRVLKHQSFMLLSLFIVICITLSLFVSCNEEEATVSDKIETDNSIADATGQSSETESTESSTPPNSSETADLSEVSSDISDIDTSDPTIEKTPEEQLIAGEITHTFSNETDWDLRNRTLVNWYCGNLMKEYGTLANAYYICGKTYPFFTSFTLHQATYKVVFKNDGIFTEKKIAILCGILPSDPQTYVLIDGHLSESSFYSLEDVWGKVRGNAKIGPFTQEYPTAVYSDGLNEIKLASLIGAGRRIFCTIPIADNNIAMISGNPSNWNIYTNEYDTENLDLKVDFVDLSTGTLQRNGYSLIDFTKQGYSYTGMSSDYSFYNNTIKFVVSIKKENSDDVYYAWYKITLNADGTVKDTLDINSTSSWDSNSTLYEYQPLYSESGRYQTFRKNRDLYLHDNETNSDILVFDCKPDIETETTDIGEYVYARELCFVGETLYYNLTGYEWYIGSACYNPTIKQTIEYNNGMFITAVIDGFAYGSTSFFDDELYFGRFSIENPEILEKLKNNNTPELSQIFISEDYKYIVKITSPSYVSGSLKVWDDTSTVTLYDIKTMSIVMTYTLHSATTQFQNGTIYGDYLYLPINNTDNTICVIKIN